MKNIGIGEKLKINCRSIIKDFEKLLGPEYNWNKKINFSNWAEYTNKGNQLLKTPSFNDKYRKILFMVGKHMQVKDFYYQAYPTFRIQLPNTKSVSFHRDDISSGHAENIFNFWFPLTELNQKNCIWIVDKKNSNTLIKKFKKEHLTFEELDILAKRKAKPAIIKKNEMLCFSNKTLHGTVDNKSDKMRISIDFRCLAINEDPGKKILGVDYIKFSKKIKNLLKKCTSVIFQSGDLSHIGHNAQRAVINDFAARNNFSIIRETSEWHHLNFYPVILDILKKTPDMPVLIFSKSSFDHKSDAWKELSLKLKKHKGEVYFCLENELYNR
jgi:hypothetical protein